jgi:hypothetical protein
VRAHVSCSRFQTVALASILVALAGCTAGPGNKPGTLQWKTYTDVTPLEFSPAVWTTGGLRHEMTSARYEKHYTAVSVSSYRLRFEFKVTNTGARSVDLNKVPRPKASLSLKDGGPAPSMIWIYSSRSPNALLEPGQTARAELFNDNSVPEGARPGQLRVGGIDVNWP